MRVHPIKAAIDAACLKHGITHSAIAENADVARETLYRIMRGDAQRASGLLKTYMSSVAPIQLYATLGTLAALIALTLGATPSMSKAKSIHTRASRAR